MSNLNKIKVVDFTMGRRSSDDVNTDIPFSDNFAKTRSIQQANVVLGAYVDRNYKDNRQWLNELENKADKDEIPSKTSDLTNDGSDGENPFITNQVNDLVNYTNNDDLATLLNGKASNTDLTNVKSAIDYKSPNYVGNVIVESIRSKNILGLLNYIITNSNASYNIINNNLINVFSTGIWGFSMIENFKVDINTNYTFSCNLVNYQNVNCGIIIYDSNDNTLGFQSTTNYEDNLTITFSSTTPIIKIKFAVNNTGDYHDNFATYYDIQVEKGSVATSFSSYQNLDNPGTILFDGESTSTDIQLLDSLNKYEYVDIYYGNIYSGIKKIKLKVSNNNTFVLSSTELDNGNNADFGLVIVNNKYTFDTNYLRYLGTSRVYKYESGNWVQDRNNSTYIYRVVGY